MVNPAFAGIDDVIIDVPQSKDGMNPTFSGSRSVLIEGPSAPNHDVVVDIEVDNPTLATDHSASGRFQTGRFPNDLFKGIDADVMVENASEPEVPADMVSHTWICGSL